LPHSTYPFAPGYVGQRLCQFRSRDDTVAKSTVLRCICISSNCKAYPNARDSPIGPFPRPGLVTFPYLREASPKNLTKSCHECCKQLPTIVWEVFIFVPSYPPSLICGGFPPCSPLFQPELHRSPGGHLPQGRRAPGHPLPRLPRLPPLLVCARFSWSRPCVWVQSPKMEGIDILCLICGKKGFP